MQADASIASNVMHHAAVQLTSDGKALSLPTNSDYYNGRRHDHLTRYSC
jgi:hypothetical protein